MLALTVDQTKELQCILADSLWALAQRPHGPATAECMRSVRELKDCVDSYLAVECKPREAS
jgi:hypothetical protein